MFWFYQAGVKLRKRLGTHIGQISTIVAATCHERPTSPVISGGICTEVRPSPLKAKCSDDHDGPMGQWDIPKDSQGY